MDVFCLLPRGKWRMGVEFFRMINTCENRPFVGGFSIDMDYFLMQVPSVFASNQSLNSSKYCSMPIDLA